MRQCTAWLLCLLGEATEHFHLPHACQEAEQRQRNNQSVIDCSPGLLLAARLARHVNLHRCRSNCVMRPGRPLWQVCVHMGNACSTTLIIPSLLRAALNHTAGPGPGVARCIWVMYSCVYNDAALQIGFGVQSQ